MQNSLYILQVSFKFELENVIRELEAIGRAIGGWYKSAMHGKKSVAFVIVSKKTQEAEFAYAPTYNDTIVVTLTY